MCDGNNYRGEDDCLICNLFVLVAIGFLERVNSLVCVFYNIAVRFTVLRYVFVYACEDVLVSTNMRSYGEFSFYFKF